MVLSPKLLAFLALLSISAVVASPVPADGAVEKRKAADYGNYGNYGAYGKYGAYPPPSPTPTGGYGKYGTYGSYARAAEEDAK
ncbi:hypothetical protein GJ744_000526 [Endocarpon pusillum]|uniref:Uncharacterized protein n=1 Tax=Endocarpon pusillum TaxID=364733 RepID=A0A8H7E189_9EURO|nr:hypothetical protein GJ744_000526 [Endocarpon pusillum]